MYKYLQLKIKKLKGENVMKSLLNNQEDQLIEALACSSKVASYCGYEATVDQDEGSIQLTIIMTLFLSCKSITPSCQYA